MFEIAAVGKILSLFVDVNETLSIVSGVAAEDIPKLDCPCSVGGKGVPAEAEA